MHFSAKNNILHFPTNGPIWDLLGSNLHFFTAFSITTKKFVEFEEKRGKLSSTKGVGSVH